MRKDARRHSLLPSPEDREQIAPDAFKAEVHAWAARLDVRPTDIHLAGMATKWASCSQRGRVTFDTQLLGQPEGFRREVIIHELLHLKVRNHGPLFRALLSAHLAAPNGGADPAVR